MAGPSAISPRLVHHFSSTDLRQIEAGSPRLLQLSDELLAMIGSWTATGLAPGESAKNATQFGRVCILTYLVSHTQEIEEVVATVALAKAVVERHLTSREFGQPKGAGNFKRSMEKAKCEALHLAFKEKTSKCGIQQTSDEYAQQAVALQQNLKKLCQQMGTEEPPAVRVFFGLYYSNEASMRLKTIRVLMLFTKKVIFDMTDEYAAQPLSSITIENFQEKVSHLNPLFEVFEKGEVATPYRIFIEARVRKAILATHGPEELIEAARHEGDKIANFYKELSNLDLSSWTKREMRSKALHKIID